MLEFSDLEIKDREKAVKCLEKSDFMGCEYSFANNLAWKRLADTKACFFKDFYILRSVSPDGSPYFVMPSGEGNYSELFAELKKVSGFCGVPLRISGVTQRSLPLFEELFSGQYTVTPDRDNSDYIYSTKNLAELSGRKYHSKRNHLARFGRTDYEYSPMTENDFSDCILFTALAYNSKYSENDPSLIAEQYALNTYFTFFDRLGLKGGVIRIDGKVCAVTIGEKLNSDTFCVHTEKADTSFEGIYAGINNCFARSEAMDCKYINREEDLGIEGLRKSKLSYHPDFILTKNIIEFK